MLKNYILTALRYLLKNRSYAALNILGLAIGLACFLLLTMFVQQEFSYDEFHEKKSSLYQVNLADTTSGEPQYSIQTQAPLAPLVQESVPEIINSARFYKDAEKVIKVGENRYLEDEIHFADQSIFEMFDLPMANGFKGGLEMNINDMVISENRAIKLFGSVERAIGAEVEIVDLGKYHIKDVFKDVPENSHFEFDYILSFKGAQKPFEGWGDKSIFEWGFLSAFPVYVELIEGEHDISAIEKRMQEAIAPHQTRLIKLLPLPEIYFSELSKSKFGKKGNKQYAQLYLAIAFIILIVAAVNYMNLATARLTRRSKEVGIRKTVGGHRNQIIRQFLVESMVIAFISLVFAICLAEISIPFLNELVQKQVSIDYSNPLVLLFLVGTGLFVGVLSGAYPAFYLSRFNPIQILAGQRIANRTRFSFRQVLVGFQFFTCLGLMTTTAIVFKQFKHMEGLNKGFDDEQVISLSIKDKSLIENYTNFKAELKSSPLVKEVAGVSFPVFTSSGTFYVQPEGMEERVPVVFMQVEKNFLSTMGIGFEFGEDFDAVNDALNADHIIVNNAARESFGWDEPIGKKILKYSVGGVTKDFIYGSAKQSIDPLMILTQKEGFEHAYIRLSSNNYREALIHIQNTFEKFSGSYPFEYTFLDDDFAKKYEKEQRLSKVFSTFSALAIFVAGLGILGLSIYMAEQRIKEIGIRRVLGAKVRNIIWLLSRDTMSLILIVSLIVLPMIHFIMQSWLSEFSNRIELGLVLYLVPMVVLLFVVLMILMNQSVKSARSNPVNALRTE